jgi:hypothetical protein
MRATCAAGGGGIFIDWDSDNLNSSTHKVSRGSSKPAKSLFTQELIHFEVDYLITQAAHRQKRFNDQKPSIEFP